MKTWLVGLALAVIGIGLSSTVYAQTTGALPPPGKLTVIYVSSTN
jgi:hypothetical protein